MAKPSSSRKSSGKHLRVRKTSTLRQPGARHVSAMRGGERTPYVGGAMKFSAAARVRMAELAILPEFVRLRQTAPDSGSESRR
jgi:hypothetical protein